MKPIKAWHFVGKTLRDGSPVPRNGKWLKFDGPIVLCHSGLHASREPFDALQYAPGATLCLVECRAAVIEQADKLVCSERKIIERMDATEMLRYFARMQALSVIDNYPNGTDDVVFDWLMTGDGAAARSAAWSAVRSAAGSAGSAAGSAGWSAAWSAVWSARSAARADFNETVNNCFADYL